MTKDDIFLWIYDTFLKEYGSQGWWPLTPPGSVESKHHQGRPATERDRFEICCGAILTQNTAWTNVEKALVCNATNIKRLAKIFNSTDTAQWRGSVTLYVDQEVEFANRIVGGIRVKPAQQAQPQIDDTDIPF